MANEQQEIGIELKLKWVVPHDVPTLRTTHVVAQRLSKEEYLVSFFEARLPMVTGTAQAVVDQLAKIGEVEAICVARLLMTPEKFEEIHKAMGDAISLSGVAG